jgi:hypothetical protein
MIDFVLSIIGLLLIGFTPGGALAAYFLLPGHAPQGLSGVSPTGSRSWCGTATGWC